MDISPQQTIMKKASLEARLSQAVQHPVGCSAKNNSRNGLEKWF
jgi:hypothetical protein